MSFADRWWCEGAGDPWLAVALATGWSRDEVQAILGSTHRSRAPRPRPRHGRRIS